MSASRHRADKAWSSTLGRRDSGKGFTITTLIGSGVREGGAGRLSGIVREDAQKTFLVDDSAGTAAVQ
jgi:hypothetical protein